jgi:hypothetical protein
MSGNQRRGSAVTRRRLGRIAVMSVSVAMLFGLAEVGAGAAQATVSTPASLTAPAFLSVSIPPGPCDPEEIGQERAGLDGKMYVCKSLGPAGNQNARADGASGTVAEVEADAGRLDELASDPAHGGKITPGSRQEARAALALEKAGRLPGPVIRDPSGAADFIDNGGQGKKWDAKAFNSNFPPNQGGYHLATSMVKIGAELLTGENVILITENLSPEAVAELKAATELASLGDRVLFWP